jgi:hypothetical protein
MVINYLNSTLNWDYITVFPVGGLVEHVSKLRKSYTKHSKLGIF